MTVFALNAAIWCRVVALDLNSHGFSSTSCVLLEMSQREEMKNVTLKCHNAGLEIFVTILCIVFDPYCRIEERKCIKVLSNISFKHILPSPCHNFGKTITAKRQKQAAICSFILVYLFWSVFLFDRPFA